MKLVFMYGPPASGKLTVANELAKLSGFKLFHNHLTRDLVKDLYPDSLKEHYDLVDTLRQKVLNHCAKHGTNLIFTVVYDGPEDDAVVASWVEGIKKNNGNICFVELTAPDETLVGRVENVSRKEHQKLSDAETLSSILESKKYPSMAHPNTLKIDTSKNSPEDSAMKIMEHFDIERLSP